MAGERDAITETRDRSVLLDFDPDAPYVARVSSLASLPSSGVPVSVLGRRIILPECALDEALCHLRLSTEGYVGPRDYEAVAITLAVLAKHGILAFPA